MTTTSNYQEPSGATVIALCLAAIAIVLLASHIMYLETLSQL